MMTHLHTPLLPLIFLILSFSPINCLPTIRELSKRCPKEKQGKNIYCGAAPPNCMFNDTFKDKDGNPVEDYRACEVMTSVQKFEIPCARRSLQDPYVRLLCNKRASIFLITVLRHIRFDNGEGKYKRSCDHVKAGTPCFMREYVGVSLSETLSAELEDEDVFYICTADSEHITTWSQKGANKLNKWYPASEEDKENSSYQQIVYNSSGIGLYWENIEPHDKSGEEFVCEFVISVSEEDLNYQESGKNKTLSLSMDKPIYIKMVQGFVFRTEEDMDIYNVSMKELPSETPGGADPSDFKFYPITQLLPLKLGELQYLSPARTHEGHRRIGTAEDSKLFKAHWQPLFALCRKNPKLCYLLDDDQECYREEREECTVLIHLEFINDYKELKVRMMVEDWWWGGFTFSEDRSMIGDIGFYCKQNGKGAKIEAQTHQSHSARLMPDAEAAKIIMSGKTASRDGELRLYCEWRMPSAYSALENPNNTESNRRFSVDLHKINYNVMVAVGSLVNGRVSYHKHQLILNSPFSKKTYINAINGSSKLCDNTFAIIFIVLTHLSRYFIKALTFEY